MYATLTNRYPQPIPTPVKSLRPAQETCEQCHWPQKCYGNATRESQHVLEDKANTPWTIRRLMRIRGGDPELGRVGGIHWQMKTSNSVEYVATDERRQVIPWVRLTDRDGTVTVYQTEVRS